MSRSLARTAPLAALISTLLAACSSAEPPAGPDPQIASDSGAAADASPLDAATDAAATGAPSTDASADAATDPSTDALAAARALCVQTINADRATLGLPPYAEWTDENLCVDGQAEADSISGTPHGAFGACSEHAQNECPGWPGTPEKMIVGCLKDMWAEGPGADFHAHGHFLNMSSTKYTKVSCGFFRTAAGKWWATQDFR